MILVLLHPILNTYFIKNEKKHICFVDGSICFWDGGVLNDEYLT